MKSRKPAATRRAKPRRAPKPKDLNVGSVNLWVRWDEVSICGIPLNLVQARRISRWMQRSVHHIEVNKRLGSQ